jgi:hypothetical protein
MEFNKFAGTIEAIGGMRQREQVHLLMQVLANPRMASRLTDDEYTVLGVATMGASYRFTSDRTKRSLADFKNQLLAVEAIDPSRSEFVSAIGAKPASGSMMSNVQSYADGKVKGMISPIIAYLVMGTGQISRDVGIFDTPVAQSTIQLIGHTEKFPPGLAQILREDFLFKFDNYARRVDNEMALIPGEFWMKDTKADVQKMDQLALDVRLKLREEGYYDPAMLRLQRKIRCKFEPARSECTNPKE